MNDTEGRKDEAEAIVEAAPAEQELGLAKEDDALPWLDTDYEEGEVEGYDAGRFFGFALLIVLLVLLAMGIVWWVSNRSPDPSLTPDGSTIDAPAGEVKEAPKDSGGKTFEGTGNVAPAVGDGQAREGQVADDNAPRPSLNANDSQAGASAGAGATGSGGAMGAAGGTMGGAGKAGASASAGAAMAGGSGGAGAGTAGASGITGTGNHVAVQVGAYSSQESAEAGWAKLQRQSDLLKKLRHRVEQGKVDGSRVFRLQALASDEAAAHSLCKSLKAGGIACQVKRY